MHAASTRVTACRYQTQRVTLPGVSLYLRFKNTGTGLYVCLDRTPVRGADGNVIAGSFVEPEAPAYQRLITYQMFRRLPNGAKIVGLLEASVTKYRHVKAARYILDCLFEAAKAAGRVTDAASDEEKAYAVVSASSDLYYTGSEYRTHHVRTHSPPRPPTTRAMHARARGTRALHASRAMRAFQNPWSSLVRARRPR